MSITEHAFKDQPTIVGERVRLEPLGIEHFEGLRPMFDDPEGRRMTATKQVFEDEMLRTWLSTRQDHEDRADFAIVALDTGRVLGEVVLNELDTDEESCNFRIGLTGPDVYGRGYGTEATALVLDYAFETVGLHRVELSVYSFNPRAQRAYEKAGFVTEGVRREALHWDGEWHDVIVMGVLATDNRPRASRS
jgi:RimJ/RimL family protein N-acetyltransferase